MATPHPRIYLELKDNEVMFPLLNSSYQALLNRMRDPRESVFGASMGCARAIESQPDLVSIMGISGIEPINMRYYTREFLLSNWFDLHKGAIVEATQALTELMLNTDVNDVPCNMLKPPFPLTYFHFHKPVQNEVQNFGIHGAYLFFDEFELNLKDPKDLDFFKNICSDNPEDCTSVKVFEFVFSVSDMSIPASAERARTILNLRLGISNNSRVGVMDKIVSQAEEFGMESMAPGVQEILIATVEAILKTMLYMGLKDARRVNNSEFSDFKKRLQSLGAKKSAKMKRKEYVKYDRIIVGPEGLEVSSKADSGGSVAPHMRRGHFRNQRFGEGLSESHIIWIQPVVVNAHENTLPSPKTYKVKIW